MLGGLVDELLEGALGAGRELLEEPLLGGPAGPGSIGGHEHAGAQGLEGRGSVEEGVDGPGLDGAAVAGELGVDVGPVEGAAVLLVGGQDCEEGVGGAVAVLGELPAASSAGVGEALGAAQAAGDVVGSQRCEALGVDEGQGAGELVAVEVEDPGAGELSCEGGEPGEEGMEAQGAAMVPGDVELVLEPDQEGVEVGASGELLEDGAGEEPLPFQAGAQVLVGLGGVGGGLEAPEVGFEL